MQKVVNDKMKNSLKKVFFVGARDNSKIARDDAISVLPGCIYRRE
jgi:hypothetical protein